MGMDTYYETQGRKSKMKRIRTILCSFLVCLMAILAIPTAVSAASKAPSCPKKQTIEYEKQGYHTPGQKDDHVGLAGIINVKNLSESAQILTLKSSNKKFSLEVEESNTIVISAFCDELKNGDKTNVRIKVKQDGKTYSFTCAVTFKKASCFQSFKIGNKDYVKRVNGYWMTGDKVAKKNNVKIKIVPKKGYKIDSIGVIYIKNGKNFERKVKNGKTVSLKNAVSLNVSYHSVKEPDNPRIVSLRFW